jgi:hypothetical protein
MMLRATTMSTKNTRQLRQFHAYVGERLSHGAEDLLPEEVLHDWRKQFPLEDDDDPLDENLDDETAVRRALNDMKAGEKGMPLEELVQRVEREFKLGAKKQKMS